MERCYLEYISPKEPIEPEALQAFLEATKNAKYSDFQLAIVKSIEPSWTLLDEHAPFPDCERVRNGE